MEVAKAIETLGIKNINSLSEQELKKIYRGLVRKNHPDIGGDVVKATEINLAYEVVKGIIKSVAMHRYTNNIGGHRICIIPFDKLSKLYMGENLELINKEDGFTLSRKNIRSNRVILMTEVNIQYKGIVNKFNSLIVKNNRDEYEITCKIVDDTIKDESIIIRCHGKEVEAIIKGSKLTVVISFDGLVKLILFIERSIKHGQ